MSFFFYIIFSTKRNKYYFGHSNDLLGRLRRHNSNHKGFTGKADDWKIVYLEEFSAKSSAYAREREVKGWKSKNLVERLIGSQERSIPTDKSGGSLVRIQ